MKFYQLRVKDNPKYIFCSNNTWTFSFKFIQNLHDPEVLIALASLEDDGSNIKAIPFINCEEKIEKYWVMPTFHANPQALYRTMRTIVKRIIRVNGLEHMGTPLNPIASLSDKDKELYVLYQEFEKNQLAYWKRWGEAFEVCEFEQTAEGIKTTGFSPLSKHYPRTIGKI